jgi:hypothetical protein
MIATRLHVKRHSTSSLHRPSVSNIRYSSYPQRCRRASKLPSHDILDTVRDISEVSDESHERTKVEKKIVCVFLFDDY